MIYMELMDASLHDLLKILAFLPEDSLKWIALNLLQGIDYLKKELKVLHRGELVTKFQLVCGRRS